MAPEVDGIKLPNAYGGILGTDKSINKALTRLCVRPNGCNKGWFAWCSIFSTSAPKPRAEGSSPSAPAKKKQSPFWWLFLFCYLNGVGLFLPLFRFGLYPSTIFVFYGATLGNILARSKINCVLWQCRTKSAVLKLCAQKRKNPLIDFAH